jgi:hypothetical protein
MVRAAAGGMCVSGVAPSAALDRVVSAMSGLLFWLAARVEDDGG